MKKSIKHILIVTDVWNSFNGITSLYSACLNEIAARYRDHCSVTVLFPSREGIETQYASMTIVGEKPNWLIQWASEQNSVTGYFDFRTLDSFSSRFGPFDIVHVATIGFAALSAARWAIQRGLDLVGFYHTFTSAYLRIYGRALFHIPFLDRALVHAANIWDYQVYSKCRIVLTHDEVLAKHLRRNLRTRTEVENAFLDKVSFPLSIINKSRPSQMRPVRVGYVGRLAIEKSIEELISFASNQDPQRIEVHVVGDGPLRKSIQTANCIFMHGEVPHENLAKIYRCFDFLLFPSLSETLGLVLLEAAACGVPFVVRPSTPGARLAVTYHAGIVVDKLDAHVGERLSKIWYSCEYLSLQHGCLTMATALDLQVGVRHLLRVWGVL